jgi:hypothetical protein
VQNWNFAFFKTFRFSSGVLPAGTISAGRLGKVYNFSKVQQQVHQQFLLIFTFSLFRTVFLLRSQLLLFRRLSSIHQYLWIILDSARIPSSSTCVARRFHPVITSSTLLLASIFLFAKH